MLTSLIVLFVFMTMIWLISLYAKDASIVDRIWGISFILQAIILAFLHPSYHSLLLAVLSSIWGLRLSIHIHLRDRKDEEDFRYQAMRRHHGKRFWWYSLFSVFWLQGILSCMIAAPFYAVALSQQSSLGFFSIVGLVVWSVGFYYESVADWQLSHFKKNPENRGKIMQQGVWSETRHPNYFGDVCQFWGFYLIAAETTFGIWSFFGPMLLTGLIIKVSGVALLETGKYKEKPGYANYVATTPAFVPKRFNPRHWGK